MSIVLGPNQYGKAEVHVVRVTRNNGFHAIRDLNVSVALSGDMAAVHLTGDNAAVLPTDTQKNTVFAFAKKHGIASPEDFGLLLARHFVDSQRHIGHARVAIEEFSWDRIAAEVGVGSCVVAEPRQGTGTGPDSIRTHSFVRSGRETRTALVHYDADRTTVVSGLTDLVVLNSTDSEFHGFLTDEYTTLRETHDRILATAVNAQWRHNENTDWDRSYGEVRRQLLEAFAETYSLSLQQTLYAMGGRVLEEHDDICEVRLSLPNKHHFEVDLEPFGLTNDNEVFYAADKPYGLIEGSVRRDDAYDDERAWS